MSAAEYNETHGQAYVRIEDFERNKAEKAFIKEIDKNRYLSNECYAACKRPEKLTMSDVAIWSFGYFARQAVINESRIKKSPLYIDRGDGVARLIDFQQKKDRVVPSQVPFTAPLRKHYALLNLRNAKDNFMEGAEAPSCERQPLPQKKYA